MKRVEGTSGIRLIECVSPARNRWRIRWDVQEREDGSASYMEEGFIGKPGPDTIKSVITGWYNDQTDREILSGFVYEDMPVWLSSENQFNYKAAYDLAVQTGGAMLPVTFKFGTDEEPQYRTFIREAGADQAVLTIKSLEAFEKAADGKATKIIIPSELQSLAGLVKSAKEVIKED